MSNINYNNDFDINLSRIKRRTKDKKIDLVNFKNINPDLDNQALSHENISKIKINNNIKNKIMNNSYKRNNNNLIPLSKLYTIPNTKSKTINIYSKQRKELSLNQNKKKSIRNELYNINNKFKFITSNSNSIPKVSKYNLKIFDKSNKKAHKIIERNKKHKKAIDQFATLPNFMKDRFYSDIQEKFNSRFIKKPFYYDISVQDKIIQLHQIREFWGGMSDYTNPILSTKKVRFISKLTEDRKNLRDNKKKDEESKNFVNGIYHKFVRKRNVNVTMPKLYTNSNFIEEKMEEIRKKKLGEKNGKNKTEDNMIYLKIV